MAGYLEDYGVADERRSRVVRRIVISVGVVAIGVVLYLALPLLSMLVPPLAPGWWHVRTFLGDLRRHDYQAAYREWGCARPCQDYSLQDFMADWGPRGSYAGAAAGSIRKVRPCGEGTVVAIDWPGDNQTLWYNSADSSLTFWPWGGCPAHFTAPDQTSAP
ncbi:MAG: hypothetical protein ABSH46_05075 [Bryobacteraceae bacterium]|jgi:hypothetical protein